MKNMEKILFSRHLNEIDDLEEHGRDAPLEDTAENKNKLREISDKFYEQIIRNKKKAVLFVTSPRIRAKQTAKLVGDAIQTKNSEIKVRYSVNENLRSTDQGEFILPKGYRAGEVFEGLKSAGKAFDKEVHGSDYPGGIDNIDYQFGDPILLADGGYKYPELCGVFTRYGESYRDTLVRLYSVIIDTSEKYENFLNNTEVGVVAHGQMYHVYRGLGEIAKMVKKQEIDFKTGDTVKLLWEVYKNCSDEHKVPGICMPLDFDWLEDNQIMSLLQSEIEYLKSNKSH